MNRVIPWTILAALAAGCEKQPEPAAKPIAEAAAEPVPQPSPHSAPAGASGVAAPNELLMSGNIVAADGVAVPAGATLYVMGRMEADSGPGPLVLVKRVFPVTLPMEFALTGADLMMQGGQIPDTFTLTARLDQDGDAISKTPGDLEADAGAVERGSKTVKLVLKDTVTEAKPSVPVQ